ncbi:calcium-binding protein [Actinoplanes sp. G11-F43]|uniref:calcium-binding protein n=1 Tax=Actinoplanes sp. G11-F43 TaxID=3424130 RepID=UPI003D347C25
MKNSSSSMTALRAGAITAAVLGGLLVGGPAQAAPVGTAQVVNRTQIKFTAGAKKVNYVTITRSGNTVTIDDRVTIKPGKGCKQAGKDKTRVRCTTSGAPTWGSIATYDKNDTVVNKSDLGLSIRVGSGTNKIIGGPRSENLFGGDGNDTIWGNGGNDYVYAAEGNDVVYGGPGRDDLRGGPGRDTIWGQEGGDRIDTGAGNDVAHGGPHDDSFDEATGRDVLYGDAGSDEFHQGAWHGTAREVMHGGSGYDWVNYGYRSRRVAADADGASGDDGQSGEGDSIRSDVEGLYGGSGDDWLAGNGMSNNLLGGYGDDTLYGLGGDDYLTGDDGNDKLSGGAGDDDLTGGFGSDLTAGGSGVDGVNYGGRLVPVRADLDGQTGDDGSAGERDTIGADVENLYGGWADDVLTGNGGANVIYGSGGADVIRGGGGDDTLYANDGSRSGVDKVFGEAGDDTLYYGGPEAYNRYALDGGDGADACLLDYGQATGELLNCETTGR